MEGLFFALDPIWWIIPLHFSSVVIALSCGILFAVYLWYRHRTVSVQLQRVPVLQRYEFHHIDDTDPNYAEKTLIEIRKYLSYHHRGIHSWAHIPSDIAKYSKDSILMSIIEQLEQSEYTRVSMTYIETERIRRELMTRLKI